MRDAYRGRAAAYEGRGELARAAADYDMLVFSYAVEVDAADPKAEGYADLLREAVKAYRARAACRKAGGDAEAAAKDVRRADKLEAKAEAAGKAAAKAPTVTLRNDWGGPLTIHLGEASYPLAAGETRALPCPEGGFPLDIEAGPYRVRENLEAGRSYSLAPRP